MATLADELEHDALERATAESRTDGLSRGADVPDIVKNPRMLRVVPWAGEGDDPLAETTDAAG